MRAKTMLLFFIGMALGLWGCSQHYEEGAHPPPKAPPQKVALPEGHPTVGGEGAGEAASGGTVRGTIRVASELAGRVPQNAYLYIIARERADGGPPYALKRIRAPRFPYTYTLTQADVGKMFGDGIVLAEIPEMYLVAKIDQDGLVGPPQPGDMEGACANNPLAAGAQNGDIVIDRIF